MVASTAVSSLTLNTSSASSVVSLTMATLKVAGLGAGRDREARRGHRGVVGARSCRAFSRGSKCSPGQDDRLRAFSGKRRSEHHGGGCLRLRDISEHRDHRPIVVVDGSRRLVVTKRGALRVRQPQQEGLVHLISCIGRRAHLHPAHGGVRRNYDSPRFLFVVTRTGCVVDGCPVDPDVSRAAFGEPNSERSDLPFHGGCVIDVHCELVVEDRGHPGGVSGLRVVDVGEVEVEHLGRLIELVVHSRDVDRHLGLTLGDDDVVATPVAEVARLIRAAFHCHVVERHVAGGLGREEDAEPRTTAFGHRDVTDVESQPVVVGDVARASAVGDISVDCVGEVQRERLRALGRAVVDGVDVDRLARAYQG